MSPRTRGKQQVMLAVPKFAAYNSGISAMKESQQLQIEPSKSSI
jgi:hypothetical protein